MTAGRVVACGALVAALVSPLSLLVFSNAGTAGQVCASDAAAPGVAGLDADQSANAHIIVAEGQERNIEPFGLAIALATAAQESTLRNLPYGDRDSLGLFQQRAAWGSVEQRTDPKIASGFFYDGGAGGQPGLLDIDGWQSMKLAEAAQAVQRSAFPNAYARWEDEAWDWLGQITAAGGVCPPPGAGDDPPPVIPDIEALRQRARAFASASAAGLPDPFYGESSYYRWCARLAARIHGYPSSGYPSAGEQWRHYRALGIAVIDGSPPPPGALLFYTTEVGHVAVYLGDGLAVSSDVLDAETGRTGGVYIVAVDELINGAWNLPYAGWAPPVYTTTTVPSL